LQSAGGVVLSNFITASAGYMIMSVMVDTISTNNSNFYDNDAVIGDLGGYAGIYLRDSGTPKGAIAGNWDGSNDLAEASVISYSTPYVIEWRHEGGTLYVRVNGSGEQSVASGNTSDLSNRINLGNGYTGNTARLNGKFFEGATFSTVPSGTERDNLVADFMDHIGA
jgi:hypothetical protein